MSFNEQNSREQNGRKNGQQKQKTGNSTPLDTTKSQSENYEL